MELFAGLVIASKYALVRLIGRGAMGEVWLARHDTLGGDFAIKLVRSNEDPEADATSGRFQLEAQIAAKLSRKTRHIVSVSDHGEENGFAYLVMELLEGESLEARLLGDTLTLAEVTAIVLQVSRALSLAHEEGIVHRDLKPANVFLTRDEEGRLLVKLLDFGIARTQKPFRTRSPFATAKDIVLGTPSYMSPEQARGLDTLDHRCDLWALATVTYEALASEIPFPGSTIEDIFLSICTFRFIPIHTRKPKLPPALADFFARAFASKIEERFGSAAEIAEALVVLTDKAELEKALGGPLSPSQRLFMPVRASEPRLPSDPEIAKSTALDLPSAPISTAEPTVPTKRRIGWIVALVGVAATVTIAVIGVVALNRGRQSRETASPKTNTTSTATSVANAAEPAAASATSATIANVAAPAPSLSPTISQARLPPEKGGVRAGATSSTLNAKRTPATAPSVAPPAHGDGESTPPSPPPQALPTPAPSSSTLKKGDKNEVF